MAFRIVYMLTTIILIGIPLMAVLLYYILLYYILYWLLKILILWQMFSKFGFHF